LVLGLGDIVLDGDPALPDKGHNVTLLLFDHIYSSQTPGWIKIPVCRFVDLGPGHIVLDGDPAPPSKEHGRPPLFG